jgi:hypothetical protein
MATDDVMTEAEITPETLCVSNIPQTVLNVMAMDKLSAHKSRI